MAGQSAKTRFEQAAGREPTYFSISDRALRDELVWQDSFGLDTTLRDVYDAIRHERTQTPLTIAIDGRWGSGKTTAMRWLERALAHWTEHGVVTTGTKIKARTVWFDAWKYDSKEEVWRGLIAEVILKAIEVSEVESTDVQKTVEALKDTALFLGRSFLTAAVRLLPKDAASEINDDYETVTRPEKAYLNHFNQTFLDWVAPLVSDNHRLVVFIDDLDRCNLDVALQILEATKLYAGIEHIIFVMGIDKEVVAQLVSKHLNNLGVERVTSREYLDKMFDRTVMLQPTDTQVRAFMEEILDAEELWGTLDEMPRANFAEVVLANAENNPRAIKRLILDALASGTGRMDSESPDDEPESDLRFAQGVQHSLIHKNLLRLKAQNLDIWDSALSQTWGRKFFAEWSSMCCEICEWNAVVIPPEFLEQSKGDAHLPGISPEAQELADRVEHYLANIKPERMRTLVEHVLGHPSRSTLAACLGDASMARLMCVRFDDTYEVSPLDTHDLDRQIIEDAIARSSGKRSEELAVGDRETVARLDLSWQEITDLSALSALTSLQMLDLSGTDVTDVGVLSALTSLRWLDLSATGVTDIGVLSALTSLETLDLADTGLTDIGALSALTLLKTLDLERTNVTDISALLALTSLKWLDLAGTDVTDIGALSALTSLQTLDLSATAVTDLHPLLNLESLRYLYLGSTSMTDTNILVNMKQLQSLDIRGSALAEQYAVLRARLPDCVIYVEADIAKQAKDAEYKLY
ncbi:MAG: P-loop NTPase fold protein [Phycisphaerales bacterium JB043]